MLQFLIVAGRNRESVKCKNQNIVIFKAESGSSADILASALKPLKDLRLNYPASKFIDLARSSHQVQTSQVGKAASRDRTLIFC